MSSFREFGKKFYEKVSPNYRSIHRLEKRLEGINLQIEQRMDAQQAMIWYALFAHSASDLKDKRQFFQSIPRADGTLRDIQLVENYMLRRLKKICEKNDIVYWLSYGTLLGAARHKGFIPWDDDMDISFLRSDFEKLKVVLEKDDELELRAYYYEDGRCFLYKIVFRNCDDIFWIDIVIWDYADTQKIGKQETWRKVTEFRAKTLDEITRQAKRFKKRYDHELLSPHDEEVLVEVFERCRSGFPKVIKPNCIYRSVDSVYLGGESLIPLNEIFPLNWLEFEGDLYPVPCQYEKFLIEVYHYLEFPKYISGHMAMDAETTLRVEEVIQSLGLEGKISEMKAELKGKRI